MESNLSASRMRRSHDSCFHVSGFFMAAEEWGGAGRAGGGAGPTLSSGAAAAAVAAGARDAVVSETSDAGQRARVVSSRVPQRVAGGQRETVRNTNFQKSKTNRRGSRPQSVPLDHCSPNRGALPRHHSTTSASSAAICPHPTCCEWVRDVSPCHASLARSTLAQRPPSLLLRLALLCHGGRTVVCRRQKKSPCLPEFRGQRR